MKAASEKLNFSAGYRTMRAENGGWVVYPHVPMSDYAPCVAAFSDYRAMLDWLAAEHRKLEDSEYSTEAIDVDGSSDRPISVLKT